MQLSFPSIPIDPAAAATPGALPAVETDPKAAANPQAISPLGFAQLMAAFVPPPSQPPATANLEAAAADETTGSAAGLAGEGARAWIGATTADFLTGPTGVVASSSLSGASPLVSAAPSETGRPRRPLRDQSEEQAITMMSLAQLGALPLAPVEAATVEGTAEAPEAVLPGKPNAGFTGMEKSPTSRFVATTRAGSTDCPGFKTSLEAPSDLAEPASLPAETEPDPTAPGGERSAAANRGADSTPASSPLVARDVAPPSGGSRAALSIDPQTGKSLVRPTPIGEIPLQVVESVGAESATQSTTEKFAANLLRNASRETRSLMSAAKSFVESKEQQDAQPKPIIGIPVAERAATMPVGSTHAPQTGSETSTVATPALVSDVQRQADPLPPQVALASTAHRAVEAVLSVADRFAAREQHSVSLQFTVGGSDLNVRVELRGGEVHTTFRTDSPELRSALSHEWQAVSSQNQSDRSVRIANPVFTGSDQPGTSFSSSGDGAPKQQHHDGRTPADFAAQSFASLSRAGTTTTAAMTASSTAPSTLSVGTNSVHLHTLA